MCVDGFWSHPKQLWEEVREVYFNKQVKIQEIHLVLHLHQGFIMCESVFITRSVHKCCFSGFLTNKILVFKTAFNRFLDLLINNFLNFFNDEIFVAA